MERTERELGDKMPTLESCPILQEMMKQLEEKGHQVTIQWLKSVFSPRRTLLVIDMQNDFIDGSLAVPGAEEILDKVEDLTNLDIWYQVSGVSS